MTLEKAFELGLPKWPQCVIYGKSVTREQALEIIRRTDNFFDYPMGNNREFVKRAIDVLRIPKEENYQKNDRTDYTAHAEAFDKWRAKWGFVRTEYIHNSWISCSWIGGPNGWCHPDGTIGYRHNIGKWPEVEDVYKDLSAIAEAFPFINMVCLLTDREEGEEASANVVVTFEVKCGKVELIENVSLLDAVSKCNEAGYDELFKRNMPLLMRPSRENYFPLSQLEDWAKKVFERNGQEACCRTYEELIQLAKDTGLVRFSSVNDEDCRMYEKYLASLGKGACPLSIRIMTKTENVIVESPLVRFPYDAVSWYSKLNYIDPEMFAIMGYIDEEDGFEELVRMEVK